MSDAALAIDFTGELADVWAECSQPDWDGYNALPVTRASCMNAERFIHALPQDVPVPCIGAEPDGHVTLQWGRSPLQVLSLSVSHRGELHYAALLGTGRACGTEPFADAVPAVILNLIRQVS